MKRTRNNNRSNDQADTKSASLNERFYEENILYERYFHAEDKRILRYALLVAIIFHIVALFLRFPSFQQAVLPQKPRGDMVYVRKYIPPPPKIEKPKQVAAPQKLTKKIPIPDPTPDDPEPIRELEPEPMLEPLLSTDEFMIGDPEPPPQEGPLIAGEGGVTRPVLIPETKVQPEYPDAARKEKIEGSVILQAIVMKDGSVGDIVVLRAPGKNLGFEQAAIDAVKKWKYKPATKNGIPVDVYFTVEITFSLY